jgi:hypothetical protein
MRSDRLQWPLSASNCHLHQPPMASERFQLPPSSGSLSLLKFRQPSLEELRERALVTALGLADGAQDGGDGAEGGGADADAPKPLGAQSSRPAVAVAIFKRLGRLVTISGRDVNTFDAISHLRRPPRGRDGCVPCRSLGACAS